jgi:hypothetical protein
VFLGLLIFETVSVIGTKYSLFNLNEISWRDISNKINCSPNGACMKKLYAKQCKVIFSTS